MGRKIPGKKHHGVKDPAIQKLRREFSLKDKVNAPPTKLDYQEIPNSVLEIGRLRELAKSSAGKSKQKKKVGRKGLVDVQKMNGCGPLLPGMTQRDKNLPNLKQKSGESEGMFLERIETATSDLINEMKMEAQHNVIINRNKSGEVVGVQKGKKKNLNEAARRNIRKSVQDFHLGKKPDEEKMARKEKKLMKIHKLKETVQTADGGSQKKRLGKKQRQKLKMAPKKLEKELDGMEKRYDQVVFGERVHEPPHLKKRPRGVDPNSKPSVKGLLLTQMLNPKTQVSIAARQIQEQRRIDVVQAYRDLKASRRTDKPSR